jgi:hypothetical protein
VAVDEPALRRHALDLVTPQVLQRATRLFEAAANETSADWCIVTSHASSQVGAIYVATPDSLSYFENRKYDAIVVLFGKPDGVYLRSEPDVSGRQARSDADLIRHERLIEATAILYASYSGCPAYFIEADGPSREVCTEVCRVLDLASGIGMAVYPPRLV